MVFQLQLGTDSVSHAHPQEALCIDSGTSLHEVLARLKDERQGCCLVCQDGRLMGIFTERDAVRLIAQANGLDLNAPVDEFMSTKLVTISTSDSVETAIATMSRGGFRQLPMIDEQQQPVGIVNVAGVLHYLVEHFPQYVYNLPPTPHHATQRREGA